MSAPKTYVGLQRVVSYHRFASPRARAEWIADKDRPANSLRAEVLKHNVPTNVEITTHPQPVSELVVELVAKFAAQALGIQKKFMSATERKEFWRMLQQDYCSICGETPEQCEC